MPAKIKTPTVLSPLAPPFDTVGFFGATVADAVTLYEAVAPTFTTSFDRASVPRYNILRYPRYTL